MKFCIKCGAQLNDDARFCKKCGTACWETDENEEKPAADNTVKTVNEPPTTEEKPEKKKSKLPLIIGTIAVIAIAVAVVLLVKKGPGSKERELDSPSAKTEAQGQPAETEQKTDGPEEEKPGDPVPKNTAPDSFVKYWPGLQDWERQLWGYEITKEPDGTYKVVLRIEESYDERTIETMYCTFNNGRLEYNGSVLERERESFSSTLNGTARIIEYTNGRGYFELLNEVRRPGFNDFSESEEEKTAVLGGCYGDEESMKPPYLSHTCKKTHCASEEYAIWFSDQIPLMNSDFKNMTATDIRIARNEIFARHGRLFKDEELQNHFNSCGWYNGMVAPDKFSDAVLSEVEKYNLKVIENYENSTDFSLLPKMESSVEDCYQKYGEDREKYGLTLSADRGENMQDKGSYYELPYAELLIYEPPIPDRMIAGKRPGDAITWNGYTYIIREVLNNGKSIEFVENLGVSDTLGAYKVDGGYRLFGYDDYSPTSTVYRGSIRFDKDCTVYGYRDYVKTNIEEYALTNHSIDENRFEHGFEYGMTEGKFSIYGSIIGMKDGLITEFQEYYTP